MTDRPPDPEDRRYDPDDDRPGSDPGVAYDRAVEEGQVPDPDTDREDHAPDAGDVYRSGS